MGGCLIILGNFPCNLNCLLSGRRSCLGYGQVIWERVGGGRSNGTETYDNGINMLYLKCFLLGLTLSGTKIYVKV